MIKFQNQTVNTHLSLIHFSTLLHANVCNYNNNNIGICAQLKTYTTKINWNRLYFNLNISMEKLIPFIVNDDYTVRICMWNSTFFLKRKNRNTQKYNEKHNIRFETLKPNCTLQWSVRRLYIYLMPQGRKAVDIKKYQK